MNSPSPAVASARRHIAHLDFTVRIVRTEADRKRGPKAPLNPASA